MMVNPCIDCIVAACCSQICDYKLKYTDYIIKNLTHFYDKWLHDGTTKEELPPYLIEELTKLVGICESNMNETNKIFMK